MGNDVAWRLRAGHPWLFRDALGGRPLREPPGAPIDIVDPSGTFVGRGLYDPEGPVAVRLFTRHPDEQLDPPTIRQRVAHAQALRSRLLEPTLSAHRIIHGEGDGLPGITVDRYGEYLVVHLYTAAVEPLLPALREGLATHWAPKGIYEQRRFRPPTGEGTRPPAELGWGEVAPVELVAEEEGIKFAVDVTAPLGSGLFIDLRQGRRLVARHAAGRRVLNLFSYTGAFSVHAARAGATEIVSVDLATRAHGRARRNLQLNGLSEAGHEFIPGDAIKVMARMQDRGRKFDLIIIDPPSFARGPGGQVFVAQKDYRDLVAAALGLTERGGLLACASNTAKLPLEEFDRILGDGAAHAHRTLAVVERTGLPPDFPIPAGFPEGHYLKFELCAVG